MTSKWLYLPIETEVREFDAKLLIAHEAIKRGYRVVFGSRRMMKLLNILPKGIFFYKDSEGLVYNLFKNYRARGGKVCVHDEEGFVQFNDRDYINTRLDFKTLSEIDLYLCWGDHQKRIIDDFKGKYNKDLLTVAIGHPRIDLLRNNINTKKVYNRILINTKLSAYNIVGKESGNTFMKLLQSHNMIKSEEDNLFYQGYIKYEENLFNIYIDSIKNIAQCFKDKEIMIRPHPSEEINTWIEEFDSFDNIIVEKANSISFWIEKSDLVIHTGCTTGIESVIKGKFTIAYTPIHDKKYEIQLPNEVSHTSVGTIDKLIDSINNYYDNKVFSDFKFNEKLNEHVNLKNQKSYSMILDEIDKLYVSKSCLGYLYKVILILKKYIRKNKVWNDKKLNYYTKSQFCEYFENLLVQNNIDKVDYRIEELDKNLFILNPKG